KGSEVADFIYQTPILKNIFGPIVNDLRAEKNSFVNSLGPVNFDLGIIAGNKSWNLIGSYIIPGEDDGRVSVENTKVDGYKDHLVVERTHTFIVYVIEVKEAVLKFIKEGSF
ncbi:MAG: alpha/beta hydrolase, partial [Leptospiraceae bacterium]|nr:alpha/beta hydrolase [Leptospiraceae bacterium]